MIPSCPKVYLFQKFINNTLSNAADRQTDKPTNKQIKGETSQSINSLFKLD